MGVRKRDSIPRELVARHIRDYCTRYTDKPMDDDGFLSPYEILAHRAGLDVSYIWKLAKGTQGWDVSFDAADRIFAAIGDPWAIWHSDPELQDLYVQKSAEADLMKPIGEPPILRSGGPRRSFDYEEARRLHDQGLTWKQVGEQLGVPYEVVKTAGRSRLLAA